MQPFKSKLGITIITSTMKTMFDGGIMSWYLVVLTMKELLLLRDPLLEGDLGGSPDILP